VTLNLAETSVAKSRLSVPFGANFVILLAYILGTGIRQAA